jgi:hypothetical protein
LKATEKWHTPLPMPNDLFLFIMHKAGLVILDIGQQLFPDEVSGN